jgi:hypothetical protein
VTTDAQRTARDLHRVDLISFEVVVDRAPVYVHDLRSLGHANEFEVFTASRTPYLFTEYASGLGLTRVHSATLSVGRHLPPFTEVVTPRPTFLGYVGLLKALLTFQNFGNMRDFISASKAQSQTLEWRSNCSI